MLFRSKISYAEAEPQYPLFVTGEELLRFYQEARNASADEVEALAVCFELKDFLTQKIGGYSSGMLKKLSLICALMADVELYILDEPLITIDLASAEKLYQLISQKAEQGKSFLLSSHQDIDLNKLPIAGIFEIRDKQIAAC